MRNIYQLHLCISQRDKYEASKVINTKLFKNPNSEKAHKPQTPQHCYIFLCWCQNTVVSNCRFVLFPQNNVKKHRIYKEYNNLLCYFKLSVWEINQFLLWRKTQLVAWRAVSSVWPLVARSPTFLSQIHTHNTHYTKRLLSWANKWAIDHCLHCGTRCLIFTPAR